MCVCVSVCLCVHEREAEEVFKLHTYEHNEHKCKTHVCTRHIPMGILMHLGRISALWDAGI